MKEYQLSQEVNALFDQLDQIAPQESACKKSCKDSYVTCKSNCWDHIPACKEKCRNKLSSCLDNCYSASLQGSEGSKVKDLIQSIINALEKEDAEV